MIVEGLVSLQCRVNEKTDPVTHPHKEGKQVHHQWDCKTGNIPWCDWNWRFETAKAVLCSGTLPSGTTYYGEMRVVDVHLGHVRQKLGDPALITTVRSVGYRFEDETL
jgi:hypothetical protein